MAQGQRVLFAGMFGEFSRIPLQMVLAAGFEVAGVIVPGQGDVPGGIRPLLPPPPLSSLPLLTPHAAETVVQTAWAHNLPVWEVGRLRDTAVRDTIAALQPDVALVACFSKKIPASLLAVPRHGWLNLHPSRLPDFRGPEPLFWTLRAGLTETAVTLHWLDEGLDSGDIALQQPVSLPEGESGPALTRLLAQVGGQMAVRALAQLAEGALLRQPQPAGGHYDPAPQAKDFVLERAWSARHAYNFMRGTAEWGMPYRVKGLAGADGVWLETAVAYEPDGKLPQPIVYRHNQVGIQFTPGILWAVYKD